MSLRSRHTYRTVLLLLVVLAVFSAVGGPGEMRPAALGATGATASQAHPLKMIWGPNTLPGGSSAFPLYKDLGVDVLQVQLQWRLTASARPAQARDPADPAYEWPENVTTAVEEAKAAGIQVMLLVRDTPGWANGHRSGARVPNDDGSYADFLIAASRRYPSVRHWMIWGEPQRSGNFKPMPAGRRRGPRRYARLLDRAYGALKRVNRHNKVIGGNTWTVGSVTPRDFLRWMRLPNGRPPRLDYYGHNPFSTRFPRLKKRTYYPGARDISDVDTLAAQVARTYRPLHRRPKLWLSEFTVPSEVNSIFNFSVHRRGQARWLRAGFRLADRFHRRVAAMGWFRLLDTPDLASGLLTERGQPKPALEAFRGVR